MRCHQTQWQFAQLEECVSSFILVQCLRPMGATYMVPTSAGYLERVREYWDQVPCLSQISCPGVRFMFEGLQYGRLTKRFGQGQGQ